MSFPRAISFIVLFALMLLSVPVFADDAGGPRTFLYNGDTLKPGQYIQSPDTHARLVMQADGNLVIYDMSNGQIVPKWASNTPGFQGAFIVMQPDGDFVMQDPAHSSSPIWASHTGEQRNALAVLCMQDDGNAVIYNSEHEKVWESATKF